MVADETGFVKKLAAEIVVARLVRASMPTRIAEAFRSAGWLRQARFVRDRAGWHEVVRVIAAL